MKVAVTVSDAIHAMHVGGEVTRETFVLEVPDESIPAKLKDALTHMSNPKAYISVSTSLVVETGEGRS